MMLAPLLVNTARGQFATHVAGNSAATPVVLNHSILASSLMWQEQMALLAQLGYRAVSIDTRGHGRSASTPPPYTMADLVADNIAVMDALAIQRAHFLGLSLGGMVGFGLGIHHPDRLLSLCLCDARADMPASFAAPWDERIALAQAQGTQALAAPTCERWFGKAFLEAHGNIAQRFQEMIGATSVAGFAGCAQALQGLDYLGSVARISTPTTLVVGANDGPLPAEMQKLQGLIPGAVLEVIPGAGHLPNIDQPVLFNAALKRHFERVAPLGTS